MTIDFGSSLTRNQVDGPGDDPAQARSQLDAVIARLNTKLAGVTLVQASDLSSGGSNGTVAETTGGGFPNVGADVIATDEELNKLDGLTVTTDELNKLDGLTVTGSELNSSVSFSGRLLHVQDRKASGTNGGTFSNGSWITRDLNTAATNEITGASLASNQITLPAGVYYIEHYSVAGSVDRHATRLRDITSGATLLAGTSNHADASVGHIQNTSNITGRFTLNQETVLEIQHRCTSGQSVVGFGEQAGGTFTVEYELFTDVRIWKVG